VRLCGICKRAPREDDGMNCPRIGDGWDPAIEPGNYHSCSECITKFMPLVVKRLQDLGHQIKDDAVLGGSMLS
jgi:hypothetical protein